MLFLTKVSPSLACHPPSKKAANKVFMNRTIIKECLRLEDIFRHQKASILCIKYVTHQKVKTINIFIFSEKYFMQKTHHTLNS